MKLLTNFWAELTPITKKSTTNRILRNQELIKNFMKSRTN